MSLTACGTPGCTGHLGKFPDCLTEALWELSLDHSYVDDQAGSTEFNGHYSLIDTSEWSEEDRVHTLNGGVVVTLPAAPMIVLSTESGCVYSEEMSSREAGKALIERVALAHAKWEEGE